MTVEHLGKIVTALGAIGAVFWWAAKMDTRAGFHEEAIAEQKALNESVVESVTVLRAQQAEERMIWSDAYQKRLRELGSMAADSSGP